jgi:hypothetical protein
MNSNNQRTVQHLLDREWHTIIAQQLVIYPMPELVIEPACLGQYDAELGLPCDPAGRGYFKLGEVNDYVTAYDDTVALFAEMVQDVNDAQDDGAVDFEAELMELLDGMDEAAWIRGGM